MLAEKSHYLAHKVRGNGDTDIIGEKPKGHRGSQSLKFGLGNCASVQRISQSPGLFLLQSHRARWSPTVSYGPTCFQNSVFTPVASVILLAFGVKLLPLDSGGHHGLAPLALIQGPGKICLLLINCTLSFFCFVLFLCHGWGS